MHLVWIRTTWFAQKSRLTRGIEWSLRAFASMQAVRLFLRTRALINFLMRAASTLEITNGEQRALRKFSASWNLSLLKRCFTPSNLADTFKTGPCYLGLNSGRSVSINVSKTRKHFCRNIHGARMFPQCSYFPVRETLCFQCQFLFSRCKLCVRYTAENFIENLSMRALSNLMGPFDTPNGGLKLR